LKLRICYVIKPAPKSVLLNIAVFASHNGSDLQAIIDACKSGKINAKVCVVLSNNSESKALKRAFERELIMEPSAHLESSWVLLCSQSLYNP